MLRVTLDQRRARLGRRHHLSPDAAAADVVQVAGSLCGLHATDPASVYLAAAARMHAGEIEAVEATLYEQRTLVRMLGMRRTMFVVPRDLAAVVQASSTLALLPTQRKLAHQLLEQAGVADPSSWLLAAGAATLQALHRRGQATAMELGRDVPELKLQVVGAPGTKWAATQGMSGRVLFLLSIEGLVVRGRPRGSWISSQYRWAPMGTWLGGPLPELAEREARAELIRRWLRAYGPATVADLRWWTGWTMAHLRRGLEAVGPVEVDLDGTTGILLPDDVEDLGNVAPPAPWVALLPALDPTAMGWKDRAWYLGDHRASLFDRSGNIGPSIWCDGRIVGGWAQRKDGEVVVRLLEDIGTEATTATRAEAERLTGWLGDLRVTPRFRTPLERELVS